MIVGDCYINYIDGQHEDKTKEQITEIIKNKINQKNQLVVVNI